MTEKNKERKGIAVCGTIIADKINSISAYPKCGELTQISSVRTYAGGLVPNVGADLKILCPSLPVTALGMIGRDADGEFMKDFFVKNGLDISGLREKEDGVTSFTQVMSVSGGERTLFCHAGCCAEFGYDCIDFDSLDVRMLHLGYFLLLDKVDEGDGIKILRECRKRGIKTSIDFVTENSDRYSYVKECVKYTDNLIVNEIEACRLAGLEPGINNVRKAAEKLKEAGVKENVIIHMPDCGVILSERGFFSLGSVILPENFIVGATGAGDAFCAGALLSLHEGCSEEEILENGNVSAAMSLSSADATGGMVSLDEAKEFCSNLPRRKI